MYNEKIIDAMAQIYYDQSAQEFESLINDSGIEYIAISAVPKGKKSSLMLKSKFDHRVILGTTKRFDQRNDFSQEYVDEIKAELTSPLYSYIGELHFTHADKEDGEENTDLERHVSPISPRVFSLLDHISNDPVPVFIHWEVYHWDRDWTEISEMVSRYPDLTFVWPHCGFATVDKIDLVLSTHVNIYATLSKRELKRWKHLWLSPNGDDWGGFQIVNDSWWNNVDGESIVDDQGKIRPAWRSLIDKYQDRLLFATDAHKLLRWKSYRKIIKCWRDILGQIDIEIAEKIGYKNAEKIYNLKQQL